ncbi:hypothetical protein SDC9_207920 [bioreactor metagenome]|uniref:Uncharacterized protein n=1 Tax=bioreactor metagenome TaxID=1076179 RepID=A0A645J927_9ZZZZ
MIIIGSINIVDSIVYGIPYQSYAFFFLDIAGIITIQRQPHGAKPKNRKLVPQFVKFSVLHTLTPSIID